MIADHHADSRIDELCRDSILFLVGDAVFRIPPASPQLIEGNAVGRDLRRVFSCRGHKPHRNRRSHSIDNECVADSIEALHDRRAVAILPVDKIRVAVRRLGDVRVGRYWALYHGGSSLALNYYHDLSWFLHLGPARIFNQIKNPARSEAGKGEQEWRRYYSRNVDISRL